MKQLAGKVAIITGASSGIGYEAARLFAAEGARLVIGARGEARLEACANEIAASGGEVLAVAGDVADETYAKKLVEAAMDRFGGLDIAFNNAGTMGALGKLAEMKPADWDETVQTNLTSGFFGAKYQIPPFSNAAAARSSLPRPLSAIRRGCRAHALTPRARPG